MKKIFTLLTLALLAAIGASAQTYTVAGNADILNGTTSWDATAAVNNMTDNGDDTWTLVVENCGLEAGVDYEYKVVVNHSWDDGSYPAQNAVLTVPETAMYTVTFTLEDTGLGFDISAEAVKTGSYTPGGATWTIAGSSIALLGSNWNPEDANNDMQKQADGTYKKVYTGKDLSKGTIEYKIAKNHGWGTAYPSSNAQLQIPEDGKYNVTFTFNEETHAVNAEAVKTGDAVIDHTWTIAGGPEGSVAGLDDALFGKTWDPTYTANDMTQMGGTSWVLTKKNVKLEAVNYGYKVCADHEWSLSYGNPENPADNAILTVEQAGTYDVTFRFNSETNVLSHELRLISTGIAVQPVVTQPQSAAVYDLQGRKLYSPSGNSGNSWSLPSPLSSKKGIYIQNGRKFIVR